MPLPLVIAASPQEAPRARSGKAWWRLLALVAIVLALLAARACERYALAYQSVPALDWLEAQPLFAESGQVPSAVTLASTFAPIVGDFPGPARTRPVAPEFGGPGSFSRQAASHRDGYMVTRGPDPSSPAVRRSASLAVIVFYRELRAAAWAEIRGLSLDLSRSVRYWRLADTAAGDRVWYASPFQAQTALGDVVVVGYRGPVGFEVRVLLERGSERDLAGSAQLVVEAEERARQAADAWTQTLDEQLRQNRS